MGILINTPNGPVSAEAAPFLSEKELEDVVVSKPHLLLEGGDDGLAFVGRQVDLPDAGMVDLLFVSETGLPIATEVKLSRNGEARRQVVAQVIDYLSGLTTLTVDELDQLVEGHLETALQSFDDDGDSSFERRWQAVGTNLRAGKGRVILVLDSVSSDLERIVRFLSERTDLDVRLVTITKYVADRVGTLFVPQVVVDSRPQTRDASPATRAELRSDFAAVLAAYDSSAPDDLKTQGSASTYRVIGPEDWVRGFRMHYEFVSRRDWFGAELHLENNNAAKLAPELMKMAGINIGPAAKRLEWDPRWMKGRGRLFVRIERSESPLLAAQTMTDLIAKTRGTVKQLLGTLTSRNGQQF